MTDDLQTIFSGTKLFSHLDRVAAWRRGETPPPVTMEFDLTGRCNHRCPECVGGYRQHDVDLAEARDWLAQMAGYGVRGVIFTGGGEPLMHPDCLSIVEYARGTGMDVGFISNGSLLRAEHAERLVRCCQWARLSIDAADPDVYREIHGVGPEQFERAWAAVGHLALARDAAGSSCTIGVAYLVGEKTAPGMLTATRIARDLGADYLQFRPFHWETFPVDDLLAACQAEEGGRFRVVCSAHKYGRQYHPRGYTVCHGGWFTGVVQADGWLAICCHLRARPEFYLGSLKEQGFAEIWEGPRRAEIMGRLDVGKCLPQCRADALSVMLETVRRPACHPSFL